MPMRSSTPLNGRPVVPQPWGWEMLWTLTPRYASKVLFIRRGHEIALQYHREKEESFLLRSGRLIFVIEDREGELREIWLEPGDSLHVLPAGATGSSRWRIRRSWRSPPPRSTTSSGWRTSGTGAARILACTLQRTNKGLS